MIASHTACYSGGDRSLADYRSTIASGQAEATISLQSRWSSGYCANVTIRNDGDSAITNWSLTLDPGDSSIGNLWNGRLTGTTVSPEGYNATIAAGREVSFGFCATITGSDYEPQALNLTIEGGDGIDSSGESTSGGSSASDSSPGSSSSSSTSSSSSSSSSSGSSSSTWSSSGSSSSASSSSGSSTSSSSGGNDDGVMPIEGGCSGYATRFWDCCKPHCGWSGNVPSGVSAMTTCNADDEPISANVQSSCSGGDAHACHSMVPWALDSMLAYGYAATSSGDVCGRCYQLEFTGGSDHGSRAIVGKTMIVQAINVGHDVAGGQFDIMVPGGGVGAFNGCAEQWQIDNSELGAQYGGFLRTCRERLGWNASHGDVKACVQERCNSVFGARGLDDLADGCQWFIDWFEVADNPTLRYQEVACPNALMQTSGMNRSGRNDISNSCG